MVPGLFETCFPGRLSSPLLLRFFLSKRRSRAPISLRRLTNVRHRRDIEYARDLAKVRARSIHPRIDIDPDQVQPPVAGMHLQLNVFILTIAESWRFEIIIKMLKSFLWGDENFTLINFCI